jgi:hypothetical protein
MTITTISTTGRLTDYSGTSVPGHPVSAATLSEKDWMTADVGEQVIDK